MVKLSGTTKKFFSPVKTFKGMLGEDFYGALFVKK